MPDDGRLPVPLGPKLGQAGLRLAFRNSGQQAARRLGVDEDGPPGVPKDTLSGPAVAVVVKTRDQRGCYGILSVQRAEGS